MPVQTLILERLPATLLLLGSSLLFSVIFGVILGCFAARYRHGLFDQGVTLFSAVVFAIPVFWFGLMGIVLFAVHFRWLPIGGMVTVGATPGTLGVAGDVAWHLIMPAITLGLSHLALYARVTRASLLVVLSSLLIDILYGVLDPRIGLAS